MERITIFLRTQKTEGDVKVRFRLRDGRGVDLYHKSEIFASLRDLAKFEDDGSLKPKLSIYNKELKEKIDFEMSAMHTAYVALCEKMEKSHINGDIFESEVEKALHPELFMKPKATMCLTERFEKFFEEAYRDGLFGYGQLKHYHRVLRSLGHFLTIKNLKNVTAAEFDQDMLMGFRDFVANEYKFAEKYPLLYKDDKPYIPKIEREPNTVITYLQPLRAFYNDLEEKGEIVITPFRMLGRKRKTAIFTPEYDDPVFLLKDEFRKILETEVPYFMQMVKDCFMLQCAFGCRISDFRRLTMDQISVSEDGIPYIHYLPQKTLRENLHKIEIETPIMHYALDLIKKYRFDFPILDNDDPKTGYKWQIKELLKYCKIDRPCKVYNKETKSNDYVPLYEFGGSKLCRKTHVDMMSKVQVDIYAAGLHSKGSNAVKRYTNLEMKDRFILMCAAFGEPIYKVDKDLNEIKDEKKVPKKRGRKKA